MKWGLKEGIPVDADSGPPRYVLWCCGGICQEDFTFIQIVSGHTVKCIHNLILVLIFKFALSLTTFRKIKPLVQKKGPVF